MILGGHHYGQVKILNFNETPYFLFHILVPDVETFQNISFFL